MSGAKAVRVVTREERLAICQRLLAGMDTQVAEWIRLGEKLELVTEEEKASVLKSSELLHALLKSDSFNQIESQAPANIEYLQRDIEDRIEKRAVKRQRERTVQRRLSTTAVQILELLAADGTVIDASVTETLRLAAKDGISDIQAIENAINIGIASLAPDEPSTKLTEEQKTFAERLRGKEGVESLTEWLAKKPPADDDLASKVERYIANLEVSEGLEVAAPFAERRKEIQNVSNLGKRRILLDSLTLDLAAEVRGRKHKRALYAGALSLRNQIAEIRELKEQELFSSLERIVSDWESVDIESVESVTGRATAALAEHDRQVAAKARRTVMLQAFSELGYEIREGLETAWVKDKRVVVRKSATIGHGIELSGNAESGRLQVQAVSFELAGSVRDKQRDIDIETLWCSEFKNLQKILDRTGGEVVIERAKAVGESPVKIVSVSGDKKAQDRMVRVPKRKVRDT